MCDPVTIATVSTVASTVMSGYAAQQQGQAQRAAAEYNARQMENEATRVRNKGIQEENILREQTAQMQARQRAQLAASGIDIGSGSALELQEDTQLLGDIDALRLRENYLMEAESREQQAEQTLYQGEVAEASGDLAFGTSLVTSALPVADKWFTPSSSAVTVSPGNYTSRRTNLGTGR